jgi:PST family polysaccharide transporter
MTSNQDSPLSIATGDALKKKVLRGGRAVGIATGLRSLIDFAATLITARILSPREFGLVGMVVAITGFVDMFKDMGLATVTVQRPSITKEQLSALFWLNVAAGFLLMVITAGLAPVIAWGYGEPILTYITLALSLTLFISGLSVQHQALMRRELDFERLGVVQIISTLVGVIVVIAAALSGLGLWALVLRQVATQTAGAIASWVMSTFRPGAPKRANVRELIGMGGHVTGFQVTNYVERNLDDVLIGRFSGPADLGCYTRAYELLRLPLQQIGEPAGTIALPTLSRLHQDAERYREAYLRIARPLLMVTIPLCPVLLLTADWIVGLAFGEKWLFTVPLFQWLGVSLLVKPISYSCGWLFVSQGRTQELWRWGILASVLAVGSFIAGLPWGAVGVAASYGLLDLFVRAPILFWWIGRSGPVKTSDLMRLAVPAWICAAAVALSLVGLRKLLGATFPSYFGLPIAAVLSLAVAVALMLAMPSTRGSLSDIMELLGRKKRKEKAS